MSETRPIVDIAARAARYAVSACDSCDAACGQIGVFDGRHPRD